MPITSSACSATYKQLVDSSEAHSHLPVERERACSYTLLASGWKFDVGVWRLAPGYPSPFLCIWLLVQRGARHRGSASSAADLLSVCRESDAVLSEGATGLWTVY